MVQQHLRLWLSWCQSRHDGSDASASPSDCSREDSSSGCSRSSAAALRASVCITAGDAGAGRPGKAREDEGERRAGGG